MRHVYIFVVLAAFLFGTMEVALKLAGGQMDSFQLTFLRFIIGGLLLLPFALIEVKKRKIKLSRKDYGYLLILGILCIPVSMLLFQLGVMRSNASTAAVLLSVNPLFTMVFAHFLTNEKITKQKAMSLLIGMAGLIMMIRPWDIQKGNTVMGVILMILAAMFFGLYTVMGKISVNKIGIMAQTSISFILGSLVLLVIMLVMQRPVLAGVAENFILVLYISIFVTGLGYYCYFMAIRKSDATTGSITFLIKPAIAPIIAVIVLREILLWNTYCGIILVSLASWLNLRKKNQS